jgi:hypothetical protein
MSSFYDIFTTCDNGYVERRYGLHLLITNAPPYIPNSGIYFTKSFDIQLKDINEPIVFIHFKDAMHDTYQSMLKTIAQARHCKKSVVVVFETSITVPSMLRTNAEQIAFYCVKPGTQRSLLKDRHERKYIDSPDIKCENGKFVVSRIPLFEGDAEFYALRKAHTTFIREPIECKPRVHGLSTFGKNLFIENFTSEESDIDIFSIMCQERARITDLLTDALVNNNTTFQYKISDDLSSWRGKQLSKELWDRGFNCSYGPTGHTLNITL